MLLARIFQPSKSAMQSGFAKTKYWTLVFEPNAARLPDPLTGWTSTTDINGEVRLNFETEAEAVDYAKRRGLAFEVVRTHVRKRIVKAYADNFAHDRRQPWTH